jgi:hypothetical protein
MKRKKPILAGCLWGATLLMNSRSHAVDFPGAFWNLGELGRDTKYPLTAHGKVERVAADGNFARLKNAHFSTGTWLNVSG